MIAAGRVDGRLRFRRPTRWWQRHFSQCYKPLPSPAVSPRWGGSGDRGTAPENAYFAKATVKSDVGTLFWGRNVDPVVDQDELNRPAIRTV